MDSVKLLWVNTRRSNPRLHAILNSNKQLGTVANPLWDVLYPKHNPGERCKVVAYRRISSTSFTVTNRLDLASNYHTLTIDVHTDTETFRIYNIYHDAHTANTGNETSRADEMRSIRTSD
jgi:hypothetical protein